jgi:hypothetical protein
MHIIAVCICSIIKNWIFILYKIDDDIFFCLLVPKDGLYVPKHVGQCRPTPRGSAMYIC